ncbi:LiaI-LiaF-like domain-containing protein [Zoogloea sp.]|uniref:LiaI-LiaF-like domain-containing protein n=1 Tax=Zoogloea sp. TaxID=49181 RepID=UPI0035B24AA8
MRGHFAATALILIGVVALGINLELFELDFVRLARTWWPLVLIALGVGLFLTPGERNRPD